jgi:hypothetical protein
MSAADVAYRQCRHNRGVGRTESRQQQQRGDDQWDEGMRYDTLAPCWSSDLAIEDNKP